ncbi:MAG TPA: hypothetical protein VHG30_16240 [Microvirga sp.]|nr:hypothetical protein [Microvirga sp.]
MWVSNGFTLSDGLTLSTVRLTTTADVALAGSGHAFQIGPDTGANVAVNQNTLQARNNARPRPST